MSLIPDRIIYMEATTIIYKNHHIDTDEDGHVTVYECDIATGAPDGDHYTMDSVTDAKAHINFMTEPIPFNNFGG